MKKAAAPRLSLPASFLLLVLGITALSSCCIVNKAKKTVEGFLEGVDLIEKVVGGDTSALLPTTRDALNGLDGLQVVHIEESFLVAEVKRIPKLGLKLKNTSKELYHLRVDLKKVGDASKVVFSFFKAARGVYSKLHKADDIVTKGASELFAAVIVAILKCGVVLK